MAAHQAPLSLGISRQEHWSGMPFPSPMHESEKWKGSRLVVSFPFYGFLLFLCTDHWRRLSYLSLLFFGTLHSNRYIFHFLLCLSLLFSAICEASSIFLPFCISFSWEWSWSVPPIQCHEPLFIVLQALCLSDLIPWIYLSLSMYNHKGFNLGHTWMV